MCATFYQRKGRNKNKANTKIISVIALACLLFEGVFFVVSAEPIPDIEEDIGIEKDQNEDEQEEIEIETIEEKDTVDVDDEKAESEEDSPGALMSDQEDENEQQIVNEEIEVEQESSMSTKMIEEVEVAKTQHPELKSEIILKKGSADSVEEQEAEKNNNENEENDIVISEVAWMGTETSYSDEWMELYNDGDEVDLDGWKIIIENKKEIELEGKIKSKGYYLIERTDDDAIPDVEADLVFSFGSGLNNSGEVLILENEEGNEIDKVDASGGWHAGDNDTKETMERDEEGKWRNSKCPGGTPKAQNGNDDSCQQEIICGNQVLEEGEECDDGNNADGDGCSAACLIEQSGGGELLNYVVINEALPDPVGSDTEGEWIEFHNNSEKEVSLKNCYLIDQNLKDKNDPDKFFYFDDEIVPAWGFLVLGYKDTKISLNNTGDIVEFYDPNGELLSGISFGKSPLSGYSWARKESEEYDWTSVPTPSEENYFPPREVYSKKIRFNEVLPNPEGTDKGQEWIELYNHASETIDLENWIIENGSGKRFVIKNQIAYAKSFSTVSIKNSSMSVRNRDELLKLFDPNKDLVDEMNVVGYAKSGMSYNRGSDGRWGWSKFQTPNKKNRLNKKPVIKIKKDKNVYKNVYAEFDGSKSYDKDGEKLKFKWDFGDGRRSYLKKTRHKYEEKGEYKASLRIDDGVEQVTKQFTVKVKSFPRYDIEIVGLMPNPAGVDKGNEMIVLLNNESKRINLKGYYLYTGKNKKQSVRHEIYKDFHLDPGEMRQIFNGKICKYSLYNKKGIVILRTPGGKKLSWVEYAREKIGINDSYMLNEQDRWEWIIGEPEEPEIEIVEGIVEIQPKTAGFNWTKLTINEKLRCCETKKRQRISNWLFVNRQWMDWLLKALKINNLPFDAFS